MSRPYGFGYFIPNKKILSSVCKEGDLTVQETDIDFLTPPGLLPLIEGRQYPVRGKQTA